MDCTGIINGAATYAPEPEAVSSVVQLRPAKASLENARWDVRQAVREAYDSVLHVDIDADLAEVEGLAEDLRAFAKQAERRFARMAYLSRPNDRRWTLAELLKDALTERLSHEAEYVLNAALSDEGRG